MGDVWEQVREDIRQGGWRELQDPVEDTEEVPRDDHENPTQNVENPTLSDRPHKTQSQSAP